MEEKKQMISLAELFRKSRDIYNGAFWKLMLMSVLPSVGFLLMSMILGVYALSRDVLGQSYAAGAITIILAVLGMFAFVFAVLFSVMAQAGMFFMIMGGPTKVSIKDVLKKGYGVMWPFLWVSVLTGILVLLWGLLLVIPGLIMAVYFLFAQWRLIDKKERGYEALKGSKKLVKGYWWQTFFRVLVPAAIVGLFFLIVSVFFGPNSNESAAYNAITQAISILIAPFFAAYYYYMYRNLQSLKGSDKK